MTPILSPRFRRSATDAAQGDARRGADAAFSCRRDVGFTLIELLVVIIIATGIIVLAVPTLNTMVETVRGTTGQTTVSSAINAARILSSRVGEDVSAVQTDEGTLIRYEGTAVMVCPDRSIRFLVHDPGSRSDFSSDGTTDADYIWSDDVLQNEYDGSGPGARAWYEFNGRFASDNQMDRALGYRDVEDADYVRISPNTGLVGVAVHNPEEIVAPPFAIRFNASGNLAMDRPFIFYDGNYDGQFGLDVRRETPFGWAQVPGEGRYIFRHPNERFRFSLDEARQQLPFEAIPTVMALYLFEVDVFLESTDPDGTPLDFPIDTPFEKAYFAVNARRTDRADSGRGLDITQINIDGTAIKADDIPEANVRLLTLSPHSGMILRN